MTEGFAKDLTRFAKDLRAAMEQQPLMFAPLRQSLPYAHLSTDLHTASDKE
jgi:hypothetical protein